MDFKDRISALVDRAKIAATNAATEEATKHSVILPFIQALGFDPFSLEDVVPEFIADVGVKKGEKIDYGLRIDGKVRILIEVKQISSELSNSHISQLYRYFGCSDAKIAILTNGKEFRFYSDLEETNKMDTRPFFVFDLASYSESCLKTLSSFRKEEFNVEQIIGTAVKTVRQKLITEYLRGQMEEPSDEFVKIIAKTTHQGPFTRTALDELAPIVKSAFSDIVKGSIREMLDIKNLQVSENSVTEKAPEVSLPIQEEEDGVITTQEEIDAFNVIRAICARSVNASRIVMRDTKAYCGVLLDDNKNKIICRLYFNAKSVKRVMVFTGEREEKNGASKFHINEITSMEDIYDLQDQILQAVKIQLGDENLGENVIKIKPAPKAV